MTLSTSTPPSAPAPGTPAASSRRERGKRLALIAVKLALFAVVLGFVSAALIDLFGQIQWDAIHFRPHLVGLSLLSMLGVSTVQLIMFRTLLSAYGYRLPWGVTLGLAWVPPLGKYVPGKVAAIAGAIHLQRRHGVPGAVAVSVAVMLDGLAVIAGLVVSAPLLIWHEGLSRDLPRAWLWCLLLALGGIAVLHPRVFITLLNFLLTRLKRQPLKIVPSLGKFMLPVLAGFAQWVFAGLGLWLMARAVTDAVPPSMIPLFISTAALAMTFSYLALFAAGGLGVREGIYLVTLKSILGAPVAVVVIAMRIVQTLIELTLAGVGMALLRRHAQRAIGATVAAEPAAPAAPIVHDDTCAKPSQ